MSLTNCRFYEAQYPEVDQVIMVNVRRIADMGAYVKLLEYDNIDGMILLSELSRRRIRSIQKLIRVGRNEAAVVLRVDKEKGYIDLSKRRVSPEDVVKCEERYNKSKMVHSIMRHVAENTQTPIQTLYENIVWPLNKKYGYTLDAFRMSLTNPEIWNEINFTSDAIAEELKSYLGKRFSPQASKVRAEVAATCFEEAGVDAIIRAFKAAKALSDEDHEIKATTISSPRYSITDTCLDVKAGIKRVEEAIQAARESIESEGGQLKVIKEPMVATLQDDAELQALLEKTERENAEVDGDDDVSQSDEDDILEK